MTQTPPTETAQLPGVDGAGANRRPPFGGKRQLCDVVQVRFERNLASEQYNAGELFLRPGDKVVVDTAKGPALAVVASVVQRKLVERGRILRVIRWATEADITRAAENRDAARKASKFCLRRIRNRDLDMKLCQVEYVLDRSRVLFYFSAEHRVDFRQLVRDLARELDARIEMRQIGVRDGAGLIGGIGPCGKELCCGSFLTSFRSVSIRHAKDQGLTLNPRKVSGMCGRLMCCLVYEHATYRSAKKSAPRVNRAVSTDQGHGMVTEVDLLQRKVHVYLEGGISDVYPFSEVVVDNKTIRRRRDIQAAPRPSRPKRNVSVTRAGSNLDDEYLWDDAEADIVIDGKIKTTSTDTSQRRRSRNRRGGPSRGPGQRPKGGPKSGQKDARRRSTGRRRPRKPAAEGAEPAAQPGSSTPQTSSTDEATPKKTGRRRRRRRRRRPGGSGRGEGPAPQTASGAEGSQAKQSTTKSGQSDGAAKGGEARPKGKSRRRRRRRRPRSEGGQARDRGQRTGSDSGGESS